MTSNIDVKGPRCARADPAARALLVNDMDIRVIDPNGVTNYPWCLDLAVPTNAATTGDNILDNVEQVLIENPTNGVYTVRITHKGTLTNGVQDVSVIVTGNIPTDPPIEITEIDHTAQNETELHWSSRPGKVNEIRITSDLMVTGVWALLDSVPATKQSNEWSSVPSSNSPERVFYRIHEED